MTDGLRIAHPQDCPLEGNPEVGNPEVHHSPQSHFPQNRSSGDADSDTGCQEMRQIKYEIVYRYELKLVKQKAEEEAKRQK